jgi:hypothetical protein
VSACQAARRGPVRLLTANTTCASRSFESAPANGCRQTRTGFGFDTAQLCPQRGVSQHGSITSGLASTAAASVPSSGLGMSGRSSRDVSEQSIAACRDGGRPSRTSVSMYLRPASEASAYPASTLAGPAHGHSDVPPPPPPPPLSSESHAVVTRPSAPRGRSLGRRGHWPGSELRPRH